jgi:aminopeptidase
MQEIFLKYASEEQLVYVSKVLKLVYGEYNRIIQVIGDYNTRKLSTVDPNKLSTLMSSPERKELNEILEKRSIKGDLKWLVMPYPCNALAQEAKMDLFSYEEFVSKSLFLDKENPIEEWRKIQKQQDSIVEFLNTVKEIQVIGEDTDLFLSVKGRSWENSCGKNNLPDGEIFTSPIETSINGHIRFTYPGIYMGKEIEDIFLEFKRGEVIKATAKKGEDLLQEILKVENANQLGEFAVGTNYGITEFTKNMLFDEKLGGSIHCALGMGFQELGGENMSAIHWDILKDMKVPGSKIIADNRIIYEEGKWKIENLK